MCKEKYVRTLSNKSIKCEHYEFEQIWKQIKEALVVQEKNVDVLKKEVNWVVECWSEVIKKKRMWLNEEVSKGVEKIIARDRDGRRLNRVSVYS